MLGTALLTQAQPAPENGDVATLLASPEASHLAWGAYLAGQRQEARYVPLIAPLLKHENPDVQLAAADALILLKADVPDELLSAFSWDTLTPSLILAAKSPAEHRRFLLSLLDRNLGDIKWVAVHGLLLRDPPPGYAARLLREWEPEVVVYVWEGPYGSGGRRGVGGATGTPVVRDRTGFPPLKVYELSLGPAGRSETQLVEGPFPVAYRRQSDRTTVYDYIDLPTAKGTILYYLAGMKMPTWSGNFPWKGELKYREEAGALLGQYRTSLNQLRQTLLERGLLTEQESKIEPRRRLVIQDQRLDRKIPLPALQGGL